MKIDNNVDDDFFKYFNRYLTGFIFFQNKLKHILIKYELVDLFSNYACRFIIEVDFYDIDNLSKEEKRLAHKYFNDYENSTGNRFVSFVYKRQSSNEINIEIIRSFVQHYEIAKQILNGTIKNIIGNNCSIDIMELDNEPLFIYMDRFYDETSFRNSSYDQEFENKYKEVFQTSFNLDVNGHNALSFQALLYEDFSIENVISDKELFKAYSRGIHELRSFVVENNIPFQINMHHGSINNIIIDGDVLKSKLVESSPKYYSYLDKNIIIKSIEDKQNIIRQKNDFLIKLINDSNLAIGTFILLEEDHWGKKCQEIGIIKAFKINHESHLIVEYNKLKLDLNESKSKLESIPSVKISAYINSDKMKDLKSQKLPKSKYPLFMFLRDSSLQISN